MNRIRLFSCLLVIALVSIPTFAQDAEVSGLEDLFFDSDGVKIRYVEQGEGEPLVLIHGFTGNIEMMWQLPGIMDELAKDYRVIALDCRGHGKSDKPHETEAYGAKMVDDVIGLMDHLKIEKAHLLGYSMGGMIAFRMVVDHPERIISALPCGYGWAPPGVGENDFMDRLADSLEKEGSIRPLLEVLTPNGAEMDEEQFKQVDQMIRLMNDTKALAAVARTMEDLRPDEEKLKANEIPTLTIIGGADPLHFPARSMLARMSNFEVKAIPRTDHMTAFSDPEFLSAAKAFLARHAANSEAPVGQ